MMKTSSLIICLLTITSLSFGQSSSWSWGRELPGTTPKILHIDWINNIHGTIPYQKSIAVGDTFFTHNYYQEPFINNILLSYEKMGGFIQAADLHTAECQTVEIKSIVSDNRLNLYTAGEYKVRFFIDDTVINHGNVPYIKYPEVFLMKLNPDHHLSWVKTISGFSGDYCIGLEMTLEGDLMLATLHAGNLEPNKAVILGQDTLTFYDNLVTICRTDTSGIINMIKKVSFLDNYVSDLRFVSGGDNSFYLIGYNPTAIIIDNDTILNPCILPFHSIPFLVRIAVDGTIKEAEFLPFDFILTDFTVAAGGVRYFSAYFYDTAVIAQDTLSLPSDTLGAVIIQTDSLNQVTWCKLIKFQYPNQHIFKFSLAEFLDSLYFTSYCTGTFLFDGLPIQTGDSAYLITGSIDLYGNVAWINLIGPSLDLNPVDFLTDNCGNLVLGGTIRGLVIFGDDTIQTSGSNSLGFLSRMELSVPEPIELGPDTSACDYYMIEGPPDYLNYCWNNGLSWERELFVTHSGMYRLLVSDEVPCWKEDSLFIHIWEVPSSGLPDTSLYFQDSLILNIDVPYDRYLWSTGDTASTIIIRGSSMNPGTQLYWVKMTNGLCTACDTFYITMKYHPGYEEYEESQILVFPNPAETSITVLIEPPCRDFANIDIYNIQGMLVGRSEGSGRKIILDISAYPSGIYVIRIRGDSFLYTGKFCKK